MPATAQQLEYPPLINVSGTNFYTDNRGSVVDQNSESKNERERAPVNDFAEFVIESVDGSPSWSKLKNPSADRANEILEQWASADALRTAKLPDGSFSRYGEINRKMMIGTMVVLALKLKTHGLVLGPHVVPWLNRLVQGLIESIHKHLAANSDPHPYGNIYVQSGYIAAVYTLISHNQESYRFQDEVWKNAINSIDENGYLPSELARGRRALVYHIRWLDYALMLRAARRALGLHTRPWEEARLKKVGDCISKAFCDAKAMSTIAA